MPYRPLLGDNASSRQRGQYNMAAWETYTPTWTNSGSAPTLGNGTIIGAYRREGTTLHFRGQLAIGSTTTVGTGDTRVSLPSGVTLSNYQEQNGSASWYDASAGTIYRGICIGNAAATYVGFQVVDTGTRAQSSGLADGDAIRWGATFELAP